jgi:mRNA interferase HigB
MNIVSHKRLLDCYTKHKEAEIPFEQWYITAKNAKWKCFADIKNDFNSVDSIGNQRYVFNIKGNNYRLVVVIQFVHGYIFIRFAGTHAEYDKIDCKTI